MEFTNDYGECIEVIVKYADILQACIGKNKFVRSNVGRLKPAELVQMYVVCVRADNNQVETALPTHLIITLADHIQEYLTTNTKKFFDGRNT